VTLHRKFHKYSLSSEKFDGTGSRRSLVLKNETFRDSENVSPLKKKILNFKFF
jgi:hypothetical protein